MTANDSAGRTDQARRGRTPVLVAMLLLAGAFLAGCGGGSEENLAMTVTGTEMAFDAPEQVPPGTYDVTFRNDGAQWHELAFTDPTGQVVARQSIGPGKSTVMEVELEPGPWELSCHEVGHYEAGMHGPLIVEEQ